MHSYFTETGEGSAKSRWWHMQCNHCPATAPLIEHCDVWCIKHLSDANSCLNVIATVDEALDLSKEKDSGGEIWGVTFIRCRKLTVDT